MSRSEVILEGTIKPDGTLELDQKPGLAPGRVKVVLRPAAEPMLPQESWWEYMQRARAVLEASGHRFMNEEQMMAWIQELQSEDERIEQAYNPRKSTDPGESDGGLYR